VFTAIVFLIIVGAILAGLIALIIWSSPPAPVVKSHDAIAEELRRERLETYNTSLDYAAMQFSPLTEGVRATLYREQRVREMLAAAFRAGARWQQRRQ
jgi:hypothetical protein